MSDRLLALTRLTVAVAAAVLLGAADPASPSTAPATQPAIRTKPPQVGEKAPSLSLQTLDGKKVDLAESLKKGPVVVVQLRGWVGYQCPFCTQQTSEYITKSKEILAKASQVIFVYPGPADGLKAHAQDFIGGKGLPDGYAFVTDPDMSFVLSWGLRWNKESETAFPATFVIDKDGVVQMAKISDSHAGRATVAEIVKALGELK